MNREEKKFKSVINYINTIVFSSLLILMWMIDVDKEITKYQILATIFWVSVIIKFYNGENEFKKFFKDLMQSIIISSVVIISKPFLFSEKHIEELPRNILDLFFENIFVIIMVSLLVVYTYVNKKRENDIGYILFYTSMLFPIITMICLYLGCSIPLALIISLIITESINYFGYKKQRKKA